MACTCECAIGNCCKIHLGLHWRGLGKVCRSAFKQHCYQGGRTGHTASLVSRSQLCGGWARACEVPSLLFLCGQSISLIATPPCRDCCWVSLQRKTEQGVGGRQVDDAQGPDRLLLMDFEDGGVSDREEAAL